MTTTPLTDFNEVIRTLLGDTSDVQRWSDPVLARGLRTALRLNKLPGYALTDDLTAINPLITDPNIFALLSYHVAVLFLGPEANSYASRHRATSRSFGDKYRFLSDMQDEIHALTNGTMFRSWQNLADFFDGTAGLSLVEKMTMINVEAPFQTVNLRVRLS